VKSEEDSGEARRIVEGDEEENKKETSFALAKPTICIDFLPHGRISMEKRNSQLW